MAAKKPTPDVQEDAAETPKKGGKRLIVISLVIVLLGLGGGAGAWYFMQPGDAEGEPEVKAKPPVFLPLESFTVNLLPNEGQPQYIQAGLTLKLEDTATSELVKTHMPEVRNRILLVISSKRGNDLVPVAGKQKLAEEIATEIKTIIEPPKPAKASRKNNADEAVEDGGEKATAGADGEDEDAKTSKKKPKRVQAAAGTKIEVLFTGMIIQ